MPREIDANAVALFGLRSKAPCVKSKRPRPYNETRGAGECATGYTRQFNLEAFRYLECFHLKRMLYAYLSELRDLLGDSRTSSESASVKSASRSQTSCEAGAEDSPERRHESADTPVAGPTGDSHPQYKVHIMKILEAETVDDLEAYLEVFSVCLNLCITPGDLSSNACELLASALCHLEKKEQKEDPQKTLQALGQDGAVASCVAGTQKIDENSVGFPQSAAARVGRGHKPTDHTLEFEKDVEKDFLSDSDLSTDSAGGETGCMRRLARSGVSRGLLQGPRKRRRMQPRPDQLLELDHAKIVCLRQLRWLKTVVPTWAARSRSYQAHLSLVLHATSVPQLTNYLIIFSNLEPDPDGKLPVTLASLTECLEELHVLQHLDRGACSSSSEADPAGAAVASAMQLPVTPQEISNNLASFFQRQAGGRTHAKLERPAGHFGRKASGRHGGQGAVTKKRLLAAQLEEEIVSNLQKTWRQGDAWLLDFSNAKHADSRRPSADGDDPSAPCGRATTGSGRKGSTLRGSAASGKEGREDREDSGSPSKPPA
ncbi:hypothetical protein TGME49_246770 [Toxoplasma gondii ME49]|uniref:AP2-coincident C-terminal domain-containing protein n=5 Tax=Toxoplasma gondii TaxID=5811 RepID=A0A125YQH6_TOXGV|nr:hypothetical protein TGME49_246770 [Toxoplasma gondii ME49]EPT24887.1 hypothetical protein TGME49_246770 [Toxoplasma gondii ME49]ESS34177.1 hypothetical protein TGVEG_246770 [Toxoplasma gondii VEG]KFG46855.1 hypothetical protein TGDOM2_246770 [Toxoplasma gondii GAB2-2007-GAL-DOM2]KYF49352.1 hypothetical protein TGARI_246770 [Toxoplasma gondii ARI]|eukprot:XP_018634937.1 hypothetical protein TGME49_246770 [Toxoplasma gondii ME49]